MVRSDPTAIEPSCCTPSYNILSPFTGWTLVPIVQWRMPHHVYWIKGYKVTNGHCNHKLSRGIHLELTTLIVVFHSCFKYEGLVSEHIMMVYIIMQELRAVLSPEKQIVRQQINQHLFWGSGHFSDKKNWSFNFGHQKMEHFIWDQNCLGVQCSMHYTHIIKHEFWRFHITSKTNCYLRYCQMYL